jgi:hypothetical protein
MCSDQESGSQPCVMITCVSNQVVDEITVLANQMIEALNLQTTKIVVATQS